MKWKYVIETKRENIEKVEAELGYYFLDDFKECVLKNNNGCPVNYGFYLSDGTQRLFGSLLSFNEEDEDYILKFNDMNSSHNGKFVIVALDPFGNSIAFEKLTNNLVFLNHETDELSYIASNWDDFEKDLIDLNNKDVE